ncbi:hypothetical protein AKJ57_00190 [candidate division MSBL1 archaeon SCGC-AAA259A05]|uniref:Uncharacterized protein n=1 Tax=candidate division MSBL1 archaeon SCGC-AAA259A05 TaxID=1698259 RepID=A0A133UC16_9EURY|nr:hypothetical protein AKJ57_00190 [candidate division MSBL1 archaeon SCGC-AAA259A05]
MLGSPLLLPDANRWLGCGVGPQQVSRERLRELGLPVPEPLEGGGLGRGVRAQNVPESLRGLTGRYLPAKGRGVSTRANPLKRSGWKAREQSLQPKGLSLKGKPSSLVAVRRKA